MLKGSLREFHVPDILQLIASQQKTGVLTIEHFNDRISIGFRNGFISAAIKNKNHELEKIDTYLIASGKLSQEQYQKILDEHRTTGINLNDLLIKEHILTEDDIKDVIQFKIQEIIDEAMQWEEGVYNFQPNIAIYTNSKIKISMNTQGIILESLRRIDEWPKISAEFPDNRIIVKKTKEAIDEDEIGPEELIVFKLIDNNKSIFELMQSSGLGKFRTYSALYNLYHMGLVEKLPKIKREKKALPIKINATSIRNVVVAVGLILLVLIIDTGVRYFTSFLKTKTFYSSPTTYNYRKTKIDNALKIYFIDNEKFPETLQELQNSNLVTKKEIQGFVYKKNGSSYILK
ncbi:DUF4388 domain-containing protein [candidate division WOR-3 bacterium]|nr:DUF4388 domain-containing protein [candidate division WOR-3 bacterium]